MSQIEKLKDKLKSLPKDFIYSEAKTLLERFGFREDNKGATSGSRVKFYRKQDKAIILLHKPHPGDEMKSYAIKQLKETLERFGDI